METGKPEVAAAPLVAGFRTFLKQYGVVGMAVAVVIGGKLNALVASLVDNLIMPLVGILTPGGDWRSLAVTLAGARFGLGAFLGSLLDFAIVAWLVFLFARYVQKEEPAARQ